MNALQFLVIDPVAVRVKSFISVCSNWLWLSQAVFHATGVGAIEISSRSNPQPISCYPVQTVKALAHVGRPDRHVNSRR